MTDNEIIKAYEGLTSNQQLNLFRNFYYNDGFSTENGIVANAINDILPNYYKQQAEIERLKECENLLKAEKHSLIKTEAVKEFAEKLKEMATQGFWESDAYIGVEQIDDLLKEIIEESK